ncbi:MAG: 3-dehydroquinate synthase [Alphaproteobacteria bacterium ADurb.Bin438]|nr:MAG: 3-dehydroquinate synthase [Alphaproteobacteria bacterium ADurb.Bin438]
MAEIKKQLSLKFSDKSYDILIGKGLLDNAFEYVSKFVKQNEKIFIITDENVAPFYLDMVKNSLEKGGFKVFYHIFKSGEHTKNPENLIMLCNKALEMGLNRSSLAIALGGGVIGDLTGFFASIMFRGMKFIQIPTTLLSQVDSSVGGKTAVNLPTGKNMIGSFYQPEIVLIDVDTLKTLPKRELKAGYAEVVKYGILGDVEFFEYLEQNGKKILDLSEEELSFAISRCCKNKADIVVEDEKDLGLRALLNLGHTFAHAYEGYSFKHEGYDINHGEAVALGTIDAAKLSYNLKLLDEKDLLRIKNHYEKLELLVNLKFGDKEELVSLMSSDKKATGNSLNFILLKGIGKAYFQKGIEKEEVLKVL